jgi:hypothetical protein
VWMAPNLQEFFREEQWSLAVMCPASHEGACVKLLHFDTLISALRRG